VTHDFTIERIIDATPAAVFDAMLDPAAQREWWTDGRPVETSADLRVGGTAQIEWEADDGHTCRAEQVFVELERPSRIVFTETVYEPDAPVYACTLTFTLEARDEKTLLTLHHEGFPSASERDKHHGGTQIFFDRLTRYVESHRVRMR